MPPKTRHSLRKQNNNISVIKTDIIEINNDNKQKKVTIKKPSLRVKLSSVTVPELKNILRMNHQNSFGNKSELISRIVYMAKTGAYPSCPKCIQGRLKARLHPRKGQSKYYCPGYPISFRAPASYHQCDYVTDECRKEKFRLPRSFN